MRLLVGLCLLATSTVFAAPQKDDLPVGAIGRLGTAVTPSKEEPRLGEVTALLYLGQDSIFVGTNCGWNTWDLQKRQSRQARPVGGPTIAVVSDANHIFIGSARRLHAIEPVESAMAEPARSWESTTDKVRAVAVSGQRVVYSTGDHNLSVIDLKTGTVTGKVDLPSQPINAALTANGRILAAVTRDGACRVHSLAANGTTERLWLKRVARSERSAIQFTSDGRLLAVPSAGRVIVMECSTGRPLATLERKFGEGDVRALAFSRDGRKLAIGSAGPEPVVRVWDVATGSELASFSGHRGDLNAVAFSPDGHIVASGGTDQVVLLWRCPPIATEAKRMSVSDAWDSLDSINAADAYRAMGVLLNDPKRAVEFIGAGFRGMAGEQAKIKRWIAELDHDEFRTREIALRSLLKAGLRAAAAINDPNRKKLQAEGEQRIRLILEQMESRGLRIPESGLYGEQLRSVRGVRVLETIGSKGARAVLEEASKGPADARLTIEAKAALEVLPGDR